MKSMKREVKMKTKVILFSCIAILLILTLSLFVLNFKEKNIEKYSYSPEGILELQRANFIANSGYDWTGKDELNYAIKLNEFKKSGGLI